MTETQGKTYSLIALLFTVGARVIWTMYPSLFTCFWFWILDFIWLALWSRYYIGFNVASGAFAVGAFCNAAVTIANGGFMPVLGRTTTESVWVPLTADTRLNALADIYLGGSIGDILILGSLFGLLIRWTVRKLGALGRGRTQVTRA